MSELKTLGQEEIDFLNKIFNETDLRDEFKDFKDFKHYIEYLKKCIDDDINCVSDRIYAELLEKIALFLLDMKREYDKDRISDIKAPEEIDKVVDIVMLFLLKGLILEGYAPDDSVIEIMKEFIKRHEL
mgnify:CR=1 FL=1